MDSSNVRVELTIAMLTQTVLVNGKKLGDKLTRDDVRCKVTYVAQGIIKIEKIQHLNYFLPK